MVERVIRTLKDQCVHRHRFESAQHASRVIGDWIGFYNHLRPHQAPLRRTPAEVYAVAAEPVQKPLGQYNCAQVRTCKGALSRLEEKHRQALHAVCAIGIDDGTR